MKQSILITGGLGFLGGRIGSFLQKEGYYVKLTSRECAAAPAWLKSGELIQMNLDSEQSILEACQGVSAIIHLAALNHIECEKDPERALKVNTLGTLRLIRMAELACVKRFIYFSTAHIYGSPLIGRITELTVPRPAHSYSITHRAAEDYVLAAGSGLTGVVVRLSNGFGCPADKNANCWSLLVTDLCRQAVVEQKLTMLSSGVQRRDFITLYDVQRVASHFLSLKEGELGSKVFNVGGNWSPRIIDMARLIQGRCLSTLGFEPQIVCPELSRNDKDVNLEYSIDELLSTGFVLKGKPESEIDRLLLLCDKGFSNVTV